MVGFLNLTNNSFQEKQLAEKAANIAAEHFIQIKMIRSLPDLDFIMLSELDFMTGSPNVGV